jgi:hypothetical protein
VPYICSIPPSAAQTFRDASEKVDETHVDL